MAGHRRAQRSDLVGEWLKRPGPAAAGARQRRSAEHRRRVHGDDRAADGQPGRLMQAQLGFWQDYMTLWQNTTRRIMGMETPR